MSITAYRRTIKAAGFLCLIGGIWCGSEGEKLWTVILAALSVIFFFISDEPENH